jgi:hypothetical protein
MGISYKKLTCEQAEMHYYEYLSTPGSLLIPEEIIEHIKHCNKCIKELDSLRELLCSNGKENKNTSRPNDVTAYLLAEHFSYAEKNVTCSNARPYLTDLIDPLVEIKVPTPITAHIHNCQDCSEDLEKIRSLNLNSTQLSLLKQILLGDSTKTKHKDIKQEFDCQNINEDKLRHIAETISGILSRKDSGITTVFKMTDTREQKYSDGLYADYPVDVQVFNNSPRHHISLRKYLKPLITAAAAVIILVALFYPSSTATASVSLLDLYKSLGNLQSIHIAQYAGNQINPSVHVTQYTASQDSPIQEQVLSRASGYYAIKNSQNTLVWDVVRKILTSKNSADNKLQSVPMSEQQLSSINATMKSRFGLVPFANISDMPAGTTWTELENKTVNNNELSVYALEWTDYQSLNSGLKRKWLYYIDETNTCIYKIESYQENRETKALELANTFIVEYPDESAIESYIDNFSK